MFDRFKSMLGRTSSGDPDLTSLHLQTPPPAPRVQPAAPPPAGPPRNCRTLDLTPEQQQAFAADSARNLADWERNKRVLPFVFFGVFPQQGRPWHLSSADGKMTYIPLFSSRPAAEEFLALTGAPSVVAGVKVGDLPARAEAWAAAGINSFDLDTCPRCRVHLVSRIDLLASTESFARLSAIFGIHRTMLCQAYVADAQRSLAADPKHARAAFEMIRDHLDGANPYVHWMIAIMAGLEGDMEANAAAIARLNRFGPPFTGKLTGTSFDPGDPTSQIRTISEALVGLLHSYRMLKIPGETSTQS